MNLLVKGLVAILLAPVVIFVGVIVAYFAVAMLAGTTANLAFWPILASILVGFPIDLETALLIGAGMGMAIFAGLWYFPTQTECFLEIFTMVSGVGALVAIVLFVLGALSFFLLQSIVGDQLPKWSIFPLGLITLVSLVAGCSWLAKRANKQSSPN